MRHRTWALVLFLVVPLCLMFALIGCGSSKQSAQQPTVSLSMSDPPTCGAAVSGPFIHVYVTVKQVKASTNANASDNDSSWVDLGPNLKSGPIQVDLLGATGSGCFLANFGTANIPAGTYQQFRLILADNSTTVSNNACGSAGVNCVVPTGTTTPKPLLLSSETQTGIKIPAAQIVGGAFTVNSGENKNLNLDFDACASIVTQGNGQFRLKPVLHAGEVTVTSNITGRLVDQAGLPITTGKAIIALEQKDSAGVDRMILQTTPDSNGNFTLCPVANGAYDVVAVAITSANNVLSAYGPTLIANVSPGTTLGDIKLNLTPTSNNNPSTAPASFIGMPLLSNNSGVAVDFQVSALQQVTIGNSTTPTSVTIPLAQQQSTTATLMTAANGDCTAGTWCADLTLVVPAANITVGTLANNAISYVPAATTAVNYTLEAQAFSTGSHVPTCTEPVKTASVNNVAAGANINVNSVLSFTGCQ